MSELNGSTIKFYLNFVGMCISQEISVQDTLNFMEIHVLFQCCKSLLLPNIGMSAILYR